MGGPPVDGVLRGLFILIKHVLQDELPLGFCAHRRACCALCPHPVPSLGRRAWEGPAPPSSFRLNAPPSSALRGVGWGPPGAERRVPSAG